VADHLPIVWNVDPAQPQWPARREPMRIVPKSYAQTSRTFALRESEPASRRTKSRLGRDHGNLAKLYRLAKRATTRVAANQTHLRTLCWAKPKLGRKTTIEIVRHKTGIFADGPPR
jgi:hypothetical protein